MTEANAKVSFSPMQDFEFNITGYNLYSVNIGLKGHRGIIMYVDNNFSSSPLEINSDFSEFLCVNIRDQNETLSVCAIYRSPSSKALNDAGLFKLLSMLNDFTAGKCMFIGDFN